MLLKIALILLSSLSAYQSRLQNCFGVGLKDGQEVKHSQIAARTIEFAGCTWNVRSGGGGPGPNYWSDSAENVWVDDEDRLHLKIRKIDNKWYCSEVYTQHFTQYGEHRFLIEGRVDLMDKNIVLGLFTYADDQHEIDIEFSKWGVANATNVGSFTVQPYTIEGNSKSFPLQLTNTQTTHLFDWQADHVQFISLRGYFEGKLPAPTYFIQQWIYWGANTPQNSDQLRTHINFWLMNGAAPLDASVLEVIIKKVIQPPPLGTKVEEQKSQLPVTRLLSQNYPNPFNPNTTIRFVLPSPALVYLRIYDTQGREIAALLENQLYDCGEHEVIFDAQQHSNSPVQLASGEYFYRLTSHNPTTGAVCDFAAQKMLLLK